MLSEPRRLAAGWQSKIAGIAISITAGALAPSLTTGEIRKSAFAGAAAAAGVGALFALMRFRSHVLGDLGLLQASSVMLFLPGVALATCAGFRLTTNMTMGDPLIAAAVALAILSLLEGGRLQLPTSITLIVILLTAAWALTEAFPAAVPEIYYTADGQTRFTNPGISPSQATGLLLFAGTMILLPSTLGRAFSTKRLAVFAARAFIAGTTLNGAVGLSDRFVHTHIGSRLTGLSFTGATGTGAVGRAAGLATHPNQYALTLAMSAPLLLSFAVTARTQLGRAVCVTLIGVNAAGILVSGSRSGLLVLVIGLVLVPLLHPRSRDVLVFSAAGTGIVLALIVAATNLSQSTSLVAVDRLNNSAATYQSDALRHQFYSNAISEITSHPWRGIGFEALRSSHDIYLQLAQSGGAFALLAFLAFAGGILLAGRRLVHTRGDWRDQHLAAALTASTVVWLLFSGVQPALYDRFLYVPAGLIIGLLAAERARGEATVWPSR